MSGRPSSRFTRPARFEFCVRWAGMVFPRAARRRVAPGQRAAAAIAARGGGDLGSGSCISLRFIRCILVIAVLLAPLLAEDNLKFGQPACAGQVLDKKFFVVYLTAMKATFVLTNAVPQTEGLNRGKWRSLEAAVHNLAEGGNTVWVFSGPVFIGSAPVQTIGADQVAVPTHTYKVVLCVHENGDREMFGFVLPNVAKPSGTLSGYTVSVSKVEELTGLDFFSALPADEQKRLEQAVNGLPGR